MRQLWSLGLLFWQLKLSGSTPSNSIKVDLRIAEDYSHCEFLIHLPEYCPSEKGTWNWRRFKVSYSQLWQAACRLEVGGISSPGWLCLVYGASEMEELPPNFIKLAKDAYTPDLIDASDCMLDITTAKNRSCQDW